MCSRLKVQLRVVFPSYDMIPLEDVYSSTSSIYNMELFMLPLMSWYFRNCYCIQRYTEVIYGIKSTFVYTSYVVTQGVFSTCTCTCTLITFVPLYENKNVVRSTVRTVYTQRYPPFWCSTDYYHHPLCRPIV